jgi:hypothetical protein
VALLGIAFLVIAISISGRESETPDKPKGAAREQAPNPQVEERSAAVLERPPLDAQSPAIPPSAAPSCERELPVSAAMLTNHGSGNQRKLASTTEMIGSGPADYAILHNLAEDNKALRSTIRVPPGATEFKVTVGYRKTSLCTATSENVPLLKVAVIGDRSELDSSAATSYKARPIAVAVKGTSEITLVTSARTEPARTCASVVWSEPRFVVRLEGACR